MFTKGQIIEVFQDLLNPNSPKITQIVNEGQTSVVKPNVAHAMVFSKDTTFLNLVRGERNHENYGITHTVRHVIINEKEKIYYLVATNMNVDHVVIKFRKSSFIRFSSISKQPNQQER